MGLYKNPLKSNLSTANLFNRYNIPNTKPHPIFLIFWFCVWFVFFHSGHAWPSPQGKTNDLEMLLFVWSTFNNDLEKSMYIWRIIELMWNIKRVQEKVCMKAIIFRRCQYLYSIFCLASSGVRSGLVRLGNLTRSGHLSKNPLKNSMFISQGSLLDQTNLSQQTSALSGFCAHINAICFSMSPQSCSSTRVPTSCTSVKTCSLFSTGRGSTLRTPCRWRFSSPLLAQEQR